MLNFLALGSPPERTGGWRERDGRRWWPWALMVPAVMWPLHPALSHALDGHSTDPSFGFLLSAGHLSPLKMAWLLLLAAGLGGLHGLSPGHGKTLVSAYLVGSRGTAWHALLLGLIVTITHTAGVFALGLVSLFASRYLLPETLYPWLTAISGVVIAGLGLVRLIGRGRFHQHVHGEDHELEHELQHAHGVAHSHTHVHLPERPTGEHRHESGAREHPGQDTARREEHPHRHLPPEGAAITARSLLALGVSGGLVPCPSALIILLSAVALHQIGFGLALIVAFSVGLAAVLTAIGVAMVYARDFLTRRFTVPASLLELAPKLSGALILGIGLAIAAPAVLSLARTL
jgi:nickel/cobalt exporter